MNPLSDTFDDFIDDIINSDINLLKGELDLLIMQQLFQSINLEKYQEVLKGESKGYDVIYEKSIDLNKLKISPKSALIIEIG